MSDLGMSQVDGAKRKIEVLAYYLWEAAGRPEGRAMEHWLEAEAQLQFRGGADGATSLGGRGRGTKYGLVMLVPER